jgi:hypothetical protein
MSLNFVPSVKVDRVNFYLKGVVLIKGWCTPGEACLSVTSVEFVVNCSCELKNEPVRRLCFGLSISN